MTFGCVAAEDATDCHADFSPSSCSIGWCPSPFRHIASCRALILSAAAAFVAAGSDPNGREKGAAGRLSGADFGRRGTRRLGGAPALCGLLAGRVLALKGRDCSRQDPTAGSRIPGDMIITISFCATGRRRCTRGEGICRKMTQDDA